MDRERFLAALAVPRPVGHAGGVWLCELRDALSDAGAVYPRGQIETAYRAGWIQLDAVMPHRLVNAYRRTMAECSETRIEGDLYHLARVVEGTIGAPT